MAFYENKVNALLEEIKSEQDILANAIKMRDAALKAGDMKTYYSQVSLIHNLQDKDRSEPEKVYQQISDEIVLDFAQQMSTPPTAKITKEDIERGREQAKNDAKWKENDRKAVRKFWQERGKYFTDAQIEKQVDKRLAQAKEINKAQQKRPQSAQLPQPQKQIQQVIKPVVLQSDAAKGGSRLINAQKSINEQARQHYAQQLERQKAINQKLIDFQSQQFAVHYNNLASLNKQASFHSQSQQSFYPSLITSITPYPVLGQTKSSSALSPKPSISSAQTTKAPSVNGEQFKGYPSL